MTRAHHDFHDDVEISFDGFAPVVHTTKLRDDEDAASVGSDDTEMKPLPQADEYGNLENLPSKDGQKKAEHAHGEEAPRNVIFAAIECFKYLYSMVLLGFSVAVVMATLFNKDNRAYTAPYNIPPGGAFVLFWFLIIWLAMMEGGQGALVGLQPVDKSLYATTHPRTLKNTKLSHKGDNMERFIIGRQFLVVLVIFIINICGSAREEGVDPLGLPKIVNAIFIDNGLAMVITTIVIGQLTAQVNAAVCLLDFINNYFMLFTMYCALFIEISGLLHSVYLVQMFFALITRQPVQSNEPPRSLVMKIFFWFRVLMSLLILGFCLAITIKALADGKSGMWDGVPPAASIVIFFLLLCVVGMIKTIITIITSSSLSTLSSSIRIQKSYNISYSDQNAKCPNDTSCMMLPPLNETGSLSQSQTLFPERNISLPETETIATLKKTYVGNPSMPPFFPERTHFAARGVTSVYEPAFIDSKWQGSQNGVPSLHPGCVPSIKKSFQSQQTLSHRQMLSPERNISLPETIATLEKSNVGNPYRPPYIPERTHFAARGVSVYDPAFIDSKGQGLQNGVPSLHPVFDPSIKNPFQSQQTISQCQTISQRQTINACEERQDSRLQCLPKSTSRRTAFDEDDSADFDDSSTISSLSIGTSCLLGKAVEKQEVVYDALLGFYYSNPPMSINKYSNAKGISKTTFKRWMLESKLNDLWDWRKKRWNEDVTSLEITQRAQAFASTFGSDATHNKSKEPSSTHLQNNQRSVVSLNESSEPSANHLQIDQDNEESCTVTRIRRKGNYSATKPMILQLKPL